MVANRCYCLEGVDDINIIKNFPISEEKILKLWTVATDKAIKLEEPVAVIFSRLIEKEHRIE